MEYFSNADSTPSDWPERKKTMQLTRETRNQNRRISRAAKRDARLILHKAYMIATTMKGHLTLLGAMRHLRGN
jgi:hypothetical protein